MDLLIIGVALAGIGLVGAAVTSRGRKIRIASAMVGVAGVVLLILSWASQKPTTKRSEAIGSRCWTAAMKLDSYDKYRTSSASIWTREEADMVWRGIAQLLDPIAEICIQDTSRCDVPLATDPARPQFSSELRELIDALRSGQPCRR